MRYQALYSVTFDAPSDAEACSIASQRHQQLRDELRRLAVVDLNPVGTPSSTTPVQPDLAGLDDNDWAEARRRLELIGPLLDGARERRQDWIDYLVRAEIDRSNRLDRMQEIRRYLEQLEALRSAALSARLGHRRMVR
jgi:hypothetical protein